MPLLDLFWTMLMLFLWVSWIMVVFSVVVDIFRNRDMGGFAKAIWVLFVTALPWLGVLIYLIANGDGMAQRAMEEADRREQAARAYIQQAATVSPADELEKLSRLHASGVLSETEFASQKAKVLA